MGQDRSRDRWAHALLEHVADGISLSDAEGIVLYANEALARAVATPARDLVGRDAYSLIHHEDRARVRAAIRPTRTRSGSAAKVRARLLAGEQRTRWVELTVTNRQDDPALAGFVATYRDINDLHVLGEWQPHRLAALVEDAPAFIAVLRGEDLVFEMANRAFAALVGRDVVGRPFAAALPELATSQLVDLIRDVLANGAPFSASDFALGARNCDIAVKGIAEPDGTRRAVIIHGIDHTEQSAVRRRIEAQFKGIPFPVYVWRREEDDFFLVDCNEAARRASGGRITAFIGKSGRAFLRDNPEIFAAMEQSLEGNLVLQREVTRKLLSGDVRRLVITFAAAPPDTVMLHTEDVTDRRALEAQLRHAQRMEAVGRLAGGVAHDFNNVLSVIMTYTELIATELPPESGAAADLQEIRAASERAHTLTQQLLAFSRQQVVRPRTLDVHAIVRGMEKMLRRVLGDDVALSISALSGVAAVHADAGQLEQVLMNLAVNARDAMPNGGTLTISVDDCELPAGNAGGLAAGRYVHISVADTGCGMDEATQQRIFEPFFTTKDERKGTGLGLSTVYGIVQQSGGMITVESAVGAGTRFDVYLPKTDAELTSTRSASGPRSRTVPPEGTETVLLVDDDDAVRNATRAVLQRAGYVVLEARNAGEALLVHEQHDGMIDLLASDVVMPRMNGRQLWERLASSRPGLRVLFMSGYTDDALVHHGVREHDVAFLPKPATPEQLLRAVRAALDKSP